MNVNLLGGGDVQIAQVCLQLRVGGLQIEEGLRVRRRESAAQSMRAPLPSRTPVLLAVFSALCTWATDSSNSSGAAPFSLTIFLLRAVKMAVMVLPALWACAERIAMQLADALQPLGPCSGALQLSWT